MIVSVLKPNLFVFEAKGGLDPKADIPRVVAFAYRVGEQVGQKVYVAAFAVEGRRVGGPPLEGARSGAIVHLGREDAAGLKSFGAGRDIVLWPPHSREWSCDLISRQWRRQPRACWGIWLDAREIDGVVGNLQSTWPRRHAVGDHLGLLRSTVGPERKLAMLSYDGYFFSGKAFEDCWNLVLALLNEISEGQLEVDEDDQPGKWGQLPRENGDSYLFPAGERGARPGGHVERRCVDDHRAV